MALSIISFDFSLAKPACCIFVNNEYLFFGWPKKLSDKINNLYKESGVNIIDRFDNEDEPKDSSAKVRHEIKWSVYMADLIIDTIKPYLNKDTLIVFEGSSFSSSGNVVIQLTSRRYMLIYRLTRFVSLDNIFTYSPMTVKSTAGCSKKNSLTKKSYTKNDIILSFIKDGPDCMLRQKLIEDQSKFMKKNSVNFIDHMDDLVDSYFVLKTLQQKMNLKYS